MLADVIRLFWIKKGLSESDFYLDPELSLFRSEVELAARMKLKSVRLSIKEVPAGVVEELKGKSIEEIADEALDFWREQQANAAAYTSRFISPWEVTHDYLLHKKGINHQQLDDDLRMKFQGVQEVLRKKLIEEVEQRRREQISNVVESLIPKLKEWMDERGISKVTRDVVKMFLVESGTSVPPGSKTIICDMLYRYASASRVPNKKITDKMHEVWSME